MTKSNNDTQRDRWDDVPGSVHIIKSKKEKNSAAAAKKNTGKKK